MYNKKELIEGLKQIGIKDNEFLMIHSSFKSLNTDCPRTIIEAIEEVVTDGLIVYPTHTWSYIKENHDVFNKYESKSCVGAITNEALNMGYIRSNHPTHSVCCKGRNAIKYVRRDNVSSTPCNPEGCFGALKNGGKILFLGAKLSKNTFIHSIEEYMNVPNRFTSNKYHFISRGEYNMDYNVYRHYNEKCPHISDNYEKLLPSFLELGIANKGIIGDSESYLVDARGCFDYVCFLLKKDIHLFDDLREIKREYIEEYKRGWF